MEEGGGSGGTRARARAHSSPRGRFVPRAAVCARECVRAPAAPPPVQVCTHTHTHTHLPRPPFVFFNGGTFRPGNIFTVPPGGGHSAARMAPRAGICFLYVLNE